MIFVKFKTVRLTGKGTAGLWIRWGIRDEIIKIAEGVEPSALH